MTDLLQTKWPVEAITDPTDLERLARQMHDHLARYPHDVAETHLTIEAQGETLTYQAILRVAPQNQIQLCTVGWGRHWPHEWRALLCAAFGVPDPTLAYFDIIRGWQIVKWTWPRPAPQQSSFVVEPGEQRKPNHYDLERGDP